jgi:hypothetical protein
MDSRNLRSPRLTSEDRERLAASHIDTVRLGLTVVAGPPGCVDRMVECVPIRNLHYLGLTVEEAKAREERES